MSDQQLEIKNDVISAKVNKLPGCQLKLDVFVTPKGVNNAYAKAIKVVSKEVSLPGFRKGKAPESFIVQHYDKHIQREWRDLVLNDAFQNILQLLKMYPFRQESIKCSDFKNISRENGAEFTVEFEVSPQVPEVKINELKFEKVERNPVTQQNIEETVNYLRRYYAEQHVVDRPVVEGDFVVLDIDNLDKDPVENLCRDTPFEVVHGRMADWMIKLLVGLKVNEQIEGVSQKESQHQHTDQCADEGCTADQDEDEFEPTRCLFTVKEIKELKLPEFNDEFVKKLGVADVQTFMKQLEKDLERQADAERLKQIGDQVEDVICNSYHFELPASLLNDEKKSQVAHEVFRLKREEHLSDEAIKERMPEIEAKAVKNLEKAYRWIFLVGQIAKQYRINVTQEELARETERQLEQKKHNTGLLRNVSDQNQIRNIITNYLMSNKVRTYISALVTQNA